MKRCWKRKEEKKESQPFFPWTSPSFNPTVGGRLHFRDIQTPGVVGQKGSDRLESSGSFDKNKKMFFFLIDFQRGRTAAHTPGSIQPTGLW